jgi:hypothetical protein
VAVMSNYDTIAASVADRAKALLTNLKE